MRFSVRFFLLLSLLRDFGFLNTQFLHFESVLTTKNAIEYFSDFLSKSCNIFRSLYWIVCVQQFTSGQSCCELYVYSVHSAYMHCELQPASNLPILVVLHLNRWWQRRWWRRFSLNCAHIYIHLIIILFRYFFRPLSVGLIAMKSK